MKVIEEMKLYTQKKIASINSTNWNSSKQNLNSSPAGHWLYSTELQKCDSLKLVIKKNTGGGKYRKVHLPYLL